MVKQYLNLLRNKIVGSNTILLMYFTCIVYGLERFKGMFVIYYVNAILRVNPYFLD